MNGYQEKIARHTKRQKTQFEKTEQASVPDMARILELSDWEFETTIINMLRTLPDEIDHMKEQTSNVSKEMKTKMMKKDEKELKRNPTDQKHCKRSEDCL